MINLDHFFSDEKPDFKLIEKYGKQINEIKKSMENAKIYKTADEVEGMYLMSKEGFPIEQFYTEGFDKDQIKIIYKTFKEGYDFWLLADKKLSPEKLIVLYRALRDGIDGPAFFALKKVNGHKKMSDALQALTDGDANLIKFLFPKGF